MAETQVCNWLCDVEPVVRRAENLKNIIFPDIEEKTVGLVSIDLLTHIETCVDIGCGRGAVGRVLRELGNENKIIGVDINYPYEDNNAYRDYTNSFQGDIQDQKIIEKIQEIKPDLLIGVGLPLHVNRFIADHIDDYGIKSGGKLVLATEYNLEEYRSQGMKVFCGDAFIDRRILVYEQI